MQNGLQSLYIRRKILNPMSQRLADVLIVEDDEPTQSFLRAICKRLGYTSFSVGDGDGAKRHLDGDSDWRIILLDLYLPKADGFEVISFTKKNAPHLLLRTIIVTAAGERDIDLAREMDLVHCVLRKPIDINELGARMKECAGAAAAKRPSLLSKTI